MEHIQGGASPDAAGSLDAFGVLIQATDLDSLYGSVPDVVSALLGADGAGLQVCVAQQQLRLVAAKGLASEATAFWERVDAGPDSCCGQALRHGERVFIADVQRDAALTGSEDLRQLHRCGIRALQLTPLLSRAGDPLGLLSTHWRHTHDPPEQMLRFADALARQIARLIERLTAEDLRRTREAGLLRRIGALERIDREKDSFLAMLAHELRNPLAPIRNAGEVLAQVLHEQPAAHRALAIIRRQTVQLTRLVDDLLDIARIQQGRLTLQERPVDVGEILEQAVETVQPLIREKRQQLTVGKLQAPAFVLGDGARLVQCIANLLQNAAKYTPPGGRIQVAVAESGAKISISVRDDGAGIAPDLLPRVFDLFVQSEDTLAHSRGGLGIGLAIVKRLVHMHGGAVEAASDGEGRGSTFTMHLWRLEPAQAPGTSQSAAAAACARRVLVVDANPDAADTVAAILGGAGHRVDVAYSALSALAAADRLRPEVVVLDLDLPRMSGYEVARRLRAHPGLSTILIIALSGQKSDEPTARAAGIDRHFRKPIDVAELKRALD